MAADADRKPSVDEQLTRLKDRTKLSWDDVADLAGLSTSGLRKIRRGEVIPHRSTRAGLAYVLRVGPSEIDALFGVDSLTKGSEDSWHDLALSRTERSHHLLYGSGKTETAVTALLAHIEPDLLVQLSDDEVLVVQAKLSEYAAFVVNQTIQDRT